MADRRRTPRYQLHAPLAGEAMPMQDAIVEHVSGSRLVVIAPTAHRADEELMVHLPRRDGMVSQRGRVTSSRPVTIGNQISFRVVLLMSSLEDVPEPEGHA